MNDVNAAGNDIRELQQRLQDLGYYTGEIDGDFGKLTDLAVKDFQADYFGAAEVYSSAIALWAKAKPCFLIKILDRQDITTRYIALYAIDYGPTVREQFVLSF